nr:retrotransposon protein, putative, Ty1-copia subclass [Tanacetum cinerariifolium]
MVLTKKVDKTPYELWYGKVPNLSYLKVWRCEALVKQDMPDRLQQISVKCIFIGYPKETMRYYFYSPPENKIVVARYAEFFEKNLIAQEEKTDMDGVVYTYKARLVAKGYTQFYEVDYEETFLPVTDIRAIRILISVAALYDYEIWQMQVKTAFLNGYLDKDIYMVQPNGFVDSNHPQKRACYRIGNFGVDENSEKWPLLNHKYKLNFFEGTTITRVDSFDNNPHGFKFEHFTAFTARKFTEIELCDVIGTVVSDAIPFNNFGKDHLRRTIILEDVQEEIDLFTSIDDLMPPGIESDNYDSEGDIHFLEELPNNDSIPLPKNESSNFDHQDDPSFPRPPPEPSDVKFFFDFEPNSGKLISAVMNNIDELNKDECFDPGGEILSGEIKVHIEVLSVLWCSRLPIRMVRCRSLGTDIAKIIKKWPKPNTNEHEIVKGAQKPDPKRFSVH